MLLRPDMPVTAEMQNTGDPVVGADIVAAIQHTLADRSGEWLVSIVGSQGSDLWEMRISGPNAFERSYTLEGTAGVQYSLFAFLDFRACSRIDNHFQF